MTATAPPPPAQAAEAAAPPAPVAAERDDGPRRRLVAAVMLSACVGAVVGGSAAWGVYHRLGPVDRVVTPVLVGAGDASGRTPSADMPTYASLAAAAAPSLVTVVTGSVAPADAAAGPLAVASGFVASGDGLVVTSARGLQGATSLRIVYADGEVVDAAVAGTDAAHGVVALRPGHPPQTRPPALAFADFAQRSPRAGDLVIAVGARALAGTTVAPGTVTATGCAVAPAVPAGGTGALGAMTVDASAAAVAEGEPLLDGAGHVVGVASITGGQLVGLDGRSAASLVGDLASGRTAPRRGFGVLSCNLDAQGAAALGVRPGALVVGLTPGGPGEAAGLRPGDVVTAVGGTPVDSGHPLDAQALALAAGERARLEVWRGAQSSTVVITVGAG